jgi:hypothetical protein
MFCGGDDGGLTGFSGRLAASHRAASSEFRAILCRGRVGSITEEDVAWIKQNAGSGAPRTGEKILLMKRKDVEQENQRQLGAMPGHAEESRATHVQWGKSATTLSDSEKRRVRRALEASAPFILTVKIGALVELTRGLEAKVVQPTGSSSGDVAKKVYFPGRSEWVVTGFRRCSGGPIGDGLLTLRAKRIDGARSDPALEVVAEFDPALFSQSRGRDIVASLGQLPFRLAFAATFASTLGRTITRPVFLDFTKSSEAWGVPGVTYSALSRFPDLRNVRIAGLTKFHFIVCEKSLEFWNSLEVFGTAAST